MDNPDFDAVRDARNSMANWYPLIKDLPIPQPKTIFYRFPEKLLRSIHRDHGFASLPIRQIQKQAEKIGYPLFLRTDQASNKHLWNQAAYVSQEKDLLPCVVNTLEHNLLADLWGLDFKYLVFREYIPMATGYTAFWGRMPVNPERRYLVRDGGVVAHYPYWIEEAIENPSTSDWKEISRKQNAETFEEVKLLSSYAEQLSNRLEGFWSVDFCQARDGRWIFIDAALAEASYMPEQVRLTLKQKKIIK